MRSANIIVAVLVFISAQTQAQRLPHHNFSVGLETGSLSVSNLSGTNLFYDLELGYERIFSNYFRLGSSISLGTSFENLIKTNTFSTSGDTYAENSERFSKIIFSITPSYNIVDDNIRIFIGAGLGAGLNLRTSKTEVFDDQEGQPNRALVSESPSSTKASFSYNITPQTGMFFNVGSVKSQSSLGLIVSYELTILPNRLSLNTLNYLGLQMSFKHNFKRR